MNKTFLVAAAVITLHTTAVFAKDICAQSTPCTASQTGIIGCKTSQPICYLTPSGTNFKFLSCTSACDSDMITIPNPKYYDECATTDGAMSITCGRVTKAWSSITSEYGSAEYEVCDAIEGCYTAFAYGCNKGYYGRYNLTAVATASGTTCTRCPSIANSDSQIYGTTANTPNEQNFNNIKITECYIPNNTQITDLTGTFIYTQNCFYTE